MCLRAHLLLDCVRCGDDDGRQNAGRQSGATVFHRPAMARLRMNCCRRSLQGVRSLGTAKRPPAVCGSSVRRSCVSSVPSLKKLRAHSVGVPVSVLVHNMLLYITYGRGSLPPTPLIGRCERQPGASCQRIDPARRCISAFNGRSPLRGVIRASVKPLG